MEEESNQRLAKHLSSLDFQNLLASPTVSLHWSLIPCRTSASWNFNWSGQKVVERFLADSFPSFHPLSTPYPTLSSVRWAWHTQRVSVSDSVRCFHIQIWSERKKKSRLSCILWLRYGKRTQKRRLEGKMVIVLELQGDGFCCCCCLYYFSEVWLYALLNGRDIPFLCIYICLSKNWKAFINTDGHHTMPWNSIYSSYHLLIN